MADSILDAAPVAETLKPLTDADGQPVWEQAGGVPTDLVGPLRADHPLACHHTVRDGQLVKRETRSKVCIVGYAENSRHLAWYNDPDCEIWGVNQLYRFIPRADRWFQIHRDWDDQSKWAEGTDLRAFLREAPCPVYMIDAVPDMPMTLPFPKDWVKQQLDTHEYFTSSIAMMVGLAIAEGFQHIGLYGIDLIIGREYHFEKACVEFYLGYAQAKGIDIHLPQNSALLWQSHTYGYEMEPDYGFWGLGKLKDRSTSLAKTVQEYRDKCHIHQGRIEEAEEILTKVPADTQTHKVLSGHIADLRQDLDRLLNLLYLHDGAQQEASRMHQILEIRSRGGQLEVRP